MKRRWTALRISIGTLVALGLTLYVSYLWTGKHGIWICDDHLVVLRVLDADSGRPVAGASVVSLRNHLPHDDVEPIGSAVSQADGRIGFFMYGHSGGFDSWEPFWVIRVREERPLYSIRVDSPGYESRELTVTGFIWSEPPSWTLRLYGLRVAFFSLEVLLERAEAP